MKRVGHKGRNSDFIYKRLDTTFLENQENWVQITITFYLYPTADGILFILFCHFVDFDILTHDALYPDNSLCIICQKSVLCPTPTISPNRQPTGRCQPPQLAAWPQPKGRCQPLVLSKPAALRQLQYKNRRRKKIRAAACADTAP